MQRAIGLIPIFVSFKCYEGCRHCFLDCTSHHDVEIDWCRAREYVEIVHEQGLGNKVVFTGGEPMLYVDEVSEFSRWAASVGIGMGIITCGGWASSESVAEQALHRIRGLESVAVSVDRFHQEMIPVEYVRNVVLAAKRQGVKLVQAATVSTGCGKEIEYVSSQLCEEIEPECIGVQPLVIAGRARSLMSEIGKDVSFGAPAGVCLTKHPVVVPDGRVVGCCGPLAVKPPDLLLFGDISSCDPLSIWDRFYRSEAMRYLKTVGPLGVADMVCKEAGIDVTAGKKYVEGSQCSVCVDLFTSDLARDAFCDIISSTAGQRQLEALEMLAGISG